jgi:hypothetical protein
MGDIVDYDNPMLESTLSPQSGTMNLATAIVSINKKNKRKELHRSGQKSRSQKKTHL